MWSIPVSPLWDDVAVNSNIRRDGFWRVVSIWDCSCRVGQSGACRFARKDRSVIRHAKPLKSPNTERRPTRNPRTHWPSWWAAARSMGEEISCRWQRLPGYEAVHHRAALAHPTNTPRSWRLPQNP